MPVQVQLLRVLNTQAQVLSVLNMQVPVLSVLNTQVPVQARVLQVPNTRVQVRALPVLRVRAVQVSESLIAVKPVQARPNGYKRCSGKVLQRTFRSFSFL